MSMERFEINEALERLSEKIDKLSDDSKTRDIDLAKIGTEIQSIHRFTSRLEFRLDTIEETVQQLRSAMSVSAKAIASGERLFWVAVAAIGSFITWTFKQ